MLVQCPECDFVNDVQAEPPHRFGCGECGEKLRLPGTPPRRRKAGKAAKGGADNTTRNVIGLVAFVLVAGAGVAVWGSKLGWFEADDKKNGVVVVAQNDQPQLVPARRKADAAAQGNPARGNRPGKAAPGRIPPGMEPVPRAPAAPADPAQGGYPGVLAGGVLTRPTKAYNAELKESAESENAMVLGNLKADGKTPADTEFYTFTQKFTDPNFIDFKKLKLCVAFDGVLYQCPVYFTEARAGLKTFGIDTYYLKQPFAKMSVWFEAEPNEEAGTRGRKLCKPIGLTK